MEALDKALLHDTLRLRTELKADLRMLQWLQLENQYAFVRESAMRAQPALAPLLRLMDAKLSFLAEELLHNKPKEAISQTIEMSATGLSLDWPRSLAPGSLWLVRIDPAGTDAPLSLPAIIQRLDTPSDQSSSRIAAEFFGLTEDETDALASWIVARQARCLSRRNSPESN
ncbi:MAG: PilZ domain-containing protein [Wenzhouxiangella sp.]|nr:PilZ domain-containing protein [Wenzhouxiangella sp.]